MYCTKLETAPTKFCDKFWRGTAEVSSGTVTAIQRQLETLDSVHDFVQLSVDVVLMIGYSSCGSFVSCWQINWSRCRDDIACQELCPRLTTSCRRYFLSRLINVMWCETGQPAQWLAVGWCVESGHFQHVLFDQQYCQSLPLSPLAPSTRP